MSTKWVGVSLDFSIVPSDREEYFDHIEWDPLPLLEQQVPEQSALDS